MPITTCIFEAYGTLLSGAFLLGRPYSYYLFFSVQNGTIDVQTPSFSSR